MRRIAPILATFGLALAAPAGAPAAGTTRIDLGGPALERLEHAGVKVGAKRPARLVKGVLRLPVRQGLVTSTALLNHGGALQLRRRGRTVRFIRLQTRLGDGARVNATVAGRRIRLLAIAAPAGSVSLNPATGSASLRGARVTITRTAAKIVKRKLRLGRLPVGRLGSATVDALVSGSTTSPGAGPGGGPPQSGPITNEPPVLARPASAVDVSTAAVTWHVRDSWIRYVSTEKAVEPVGTALAGPAVPQDQHPCPDNPSAAAPPPLVYSYGLPVAHGWYDAGSGRAALYTSGGTYFSFPGHGIDLTTSNLEIELNGSASRVIARFSGSGSTDPGDKRAVLENLASPAPAPGDPAVTLKGTIPTGGSQSVFGGFYSPGDGFGCVTVSYSL